MYRHNLYHKDGSCFNTAIAFTNCTQKPIKVLISTCFYNLFLFPTDRSFIIFHEGAGTAHLKRLFSYQRIRFFFLFFFPPNSAVSLLLTTVPSMFERQALTGQRLPVPSHQRSAGTAPPGQTGPIGCYARPLLGMSMEISNV